MDNIPQIHLLVKYPRRGDLTVEMADAISDEFNGLLKYLSGRQEELAKNTNESVSQYAGFIIMLAAMGIGEVHERLVAHDKTPEMDGWARGLADLANGRREEMANA